MENQNTTGPAHWSTRRLIRAVSIPEKHRASLRRKQIHSVDNTMIVMMLSNLLNIAIVLVSFNASSVGVILAIWGYCLIFLSGFAFLRHLRSRKRDPQSRGTVHDVDMVSRSACVNGLFWAAAPLLVMDAVDPNGQMVMGIVIVGMMFAGAFLLSRVPPAAMSFVFPVAAGLVLSMQLQQGAAYQLVSVLTIVYAGVLLFAVRWSYLQFSEQHLGEAAVQEQSQLISLLLRDFEESTSDWLWQTNAEGSLEDIPLTLDLDAESANFMAKGTQLTSLFDDGEARTILETAMSRRSGFRDVVLRASSAPGGECWVSLTGKPIFEDDEFRGFRGVAADITQSKQIEDRMAHMAHYDGLTGLPNRVTMQEYLEKLVRKPPTSNTVRALIWIDLDNFKWVNDTLGHPAGDELLRHVAARINEVVAPADMIARLGGDEFAMVIERPAGGALEAFLNELRDHMRAPYDIWGSTANCSASFGVRVIDPYSTDTRQILKHADLALYDAKKTGKAQWCMFTSQLEAKAELRMRTEAELEQAMERNEFRVHFQPIVNAETHAVVGAETLLRWEHPVRGTVFPDEFIEVAEDNGLITRMGEWVIRAALAEAARLPDDVKVAVNISPLQIHSATLVSTIVNALAANAIDPSRFELEITESVLMTDTEFTLKRLRQIKDLGVRIALDDFGTGYSSLSYLRAFPFDKIKIDKSFVKDIESRPESQAITVATLNLAKSLGMRCTAEGVETLSQAEFLRAHGCDELQGFFISRAQPMDKLGHLMAIRAKTDNAPSAVASITSPVPARSLPAAGEKRA